jgi:8-oxo-dGTP diphosphatase
VRRAPPEVRRLVAAQGQARPRRVVRGRALREVWEETGLRCRLLQELASTSYLDGKGRPKLVRYWLMEPLEDQGFEPNDEVDEVRWLEIPAAAALDVLRARPGARRLARRRPPGV